MNADPSFRPVRRRDGYLALEDMGLIGELRAGDRLDVVLSWGGAYRHHRFSEEELLEATARSWRRWMKGFN